MSEMDFVGSSSPPVYPSTDATQRPAPDLSLLPWILLVVGLWLIWRSKR